MKKLLSLIALAGIFAACQPEELKTAFEVANAEATINVRVVDIRTGAAPASGATVKASDGTVSGNVVKVVGSPALAAKSVTVTVDYLAEYMSAAQSKSETVAIAALRAGGKASYDVTVIVGYPDSDYTFTYKETAAGTTTTSVEYFKPSDSHAETLTHDGGLWVRNNSEFILTGDVAWSSYNGAVATVKSSETAYESLVKSYADAFTYNYAGGKFVATPMAPLHLQVSAYCLYTAYQQYTKVADKEYTVYAEKAGVKPFVIGVITVNSIESSAAEYKEMADPNAHGHYVYGHGHAHGAGSDNAGGGIVIPE